MSKKVVRHTEPPTPEYLSRLIAEYTAAKEFADKVVKRAEAMKAELTAITEHFGQPDDKGNLWLSGGQYALKRERRSSVTLDAHQAEGWAKDKGLWGEVSEIVERLSEDKLMSLAWERQELSEEIRNLYGERVVWAFKVVEDKSFGEPES